MAELLAGISWTTTTDFPAVIDFSERPSVRTDCNAFLDWTAANATDVTEQLHRAGAILMRGTPVAGVADFDRFAGTLGLGAAGFSYAGGVSPRTRLGEQVYTSTEWSPIARIGVHHEMAYSSRHPSYVLFNCVTPAPIGGSTPIFDARQVFADLDARRIAKLLDIGVRYTRFYFKRDARIEVLNRFTKAHKTWMEVFETDDADCAESKAHADGYTVSWGDDQGMTLTNDLAVVKTHPVTGERLWFNQVHNFNHHPGNVGWMAAQILRAVYVDESKHMHRVSYADGSPIEPELIDHLLATFRHHSKRFSWQHGDILVLDNMLSGHGRDPFVGKRRVLCVLQ
jgi:alpha-ketoglutarate-dependent taurine dioxygenase